jgi:glutathione S-transferase
MMALKAADIDVRVDPGKAVELACLNIDTEEPVYLCKALALWGSALHIYVEERYPSPSLLPPDITTRAQARLLVQEIRRASHLPADEIAHTIAQLEDAYDPEQFWIIPKTMTVVDAALVPLLYFAAQNGHWTPANSPFERYYHALTTGSAFRRALAA